MGRVVGAETQTIENVERVVDRVLDVVDLVAAIQKRFGVQVRDDERVRSIRTLQDLYTYLIMVKAEQKKA